MLKQIFYNTNFGRVALIVAVVALVPACQSVPGNEASLPPAPFPDHAVGSTIVYENGASDTVVAKEKEILVTRNHRGKERFRSTNPFLRLLSWSGDTSAGKRVYSGDVNAVFPLQDGRAVRFTEITDIVYKNGRPNREYINRWNCEVEGGRTMQFAAGRVTGWLVRCDRYNRSWSRHLDTRTYLYDPGSQTVMFYRRDNHRTRNSSEWKLASVMPPVEFVSEATPIFQQALEKNPSGRELTSQHGDVSISVMPIETIRNSDGVFCRQVRVALRGSDTNAVYPLIACREGDGFWRVPKKE